MPQRPQAISLMLCDQVVFERGSHKPYLLGVFTGVAIDSFPSAPQRFDIFVTFTDGHGNVKMKLSVVHLETNEQVYALPLTVSFPDQLKVVNLRIRVRQLVYDAPGTYLFALTDDDDKDPVLAQRRVYVYEAGGSP
jgi:hypothetical protein